MLLRDSKLFSIKFNYIARHDGFVYLGFFHPNQSLGRLTEIQFQLIHGVTQLVDAFHRSTEALATHVLNSFSMHDAGIIFICMLTGWYLINVFSNVSLIYGLLILYAWWKKINFNFSERLAIWAYISINVLITVIFLIENMFLAKRYLIALSLVLMLWVPFALEKFIANWRIRKWPLVLILFLIGIYGVTGIFSLGYSKKYIRTAGDWLAVHTPTDAKIYSNDLQLLFYARHMGNEIFTQGHAFENLNSIAHGQWQQYDYLAVRIAKNAKVLEEIPLIPIKTFQNKRGDQVLIYQVHQK